MTKDELIGVMKELALPFELKEHHILVRDALLDIPCLAFYPSCWWTDKEKWHRKDVLVVLYESSAGRVFGRDS